MSLSNCSVECIWTPLLPIKECAVVYAANYIPTTSVCCAIAASVSAGIPLPGESDTEERTVLYVSASELSSRIKVWIKMNGGKMSNVCVYGYEHLVNVKADDRMQFLQGLIDAFSPQFIVIDSFELFVGDPDRLWDDVCSWHTANAIVRMIRAAHCSGLMSVGVDNQVYEEKQILNEFGAVFTTPLANIYGSTAMHGNWKSVFTLDYFDNIVGTKYILKPIKLNYSALSDTLTFKLVKNKLTWLGTDKSTTKYSCGDLLDVWWHEEGKSLLGTLTPVSEYYDKYTTYCNSRGCGEVSAQLFAKRLCSRYGISSAVRKDENHKSIRCYVRK